MEWRTVSFFKKSTKAAKKGRVSASGIKYLDKNNVRIKSFDPISGKFLDTTHQNTHPPTAAATPNASGKDKSQYNLDNPGSDMPNLIRNRKRPNSHNTSSGPALQPQNPKLKKAN